MNSITFQNVSEAFQNVSEPFQNVSEPFQNVSEPFQNISEPFQNVSEPFHFESQEVHFSVRAKRNEFILAVHRKPGRIPTNCEYSMRANDNRASPKYALLDGRDEEHGSL